MDALSVGHVKNIVGSAPNRNVAFGSHSSPAVEVQDQFIRSDLTAKSIQDLRDQNDEFISGRPRFNEILGRKIDAKIEEAVERQLAEKYEQIRTMMSKPENLRGEALAERVISNNMSNWAKEAEDDCGCNYPKSVKDPMELI